jgi:hypothetical protein
MPERHLIMRGSCVAGMGWPAALRCPLAGLAGHVVAVSQALGSFAPRPAFEVIIFAHGNVDFDGHLSVICGSLVN